MSCGSGWGVAVRRIALMAGAVLALGATPALALTPTTCANLATDMNAATSGEVLQLPAGTCTTNVVITNTNAFTLEGATTGTTTLTPAVTSSPIISSSADVKFTLMTLTLTGAKPALELNGPNQAVTVTGDTFTGNVSTSLGSAIDVGSTGPRTSTQPMVIAHSTFSGNESSAGGAIIVTAALPLEITDNTFTGNSSPVGGGALVVLGGSVASGAVHISGNTFTGNSTENVGGAVWLELRHTQSATITGNTFRANKITGSHTASSFFERLGAGLFVVVAFEDTPFAVTQSHNTFISNVIDETQASPTPALTAGGAGEWVTGVSVNSVGDQFIGNRVAVNDGLPPEGGALGVFASQATSTTPAFPGKFVGTNDLFAGNSTAVGGWGGGLYVGGPTPNCTGTCPPSSLALNDSTIVRNRVDAGAGSEGGAIWGSPNDGLALRNTIVSANTPHPELFGFSAVHPPIAFSDVCNEAGGPPVPAGAHNICADPRLAASGAETNLSPTLDAGSNALVPAGVTTDILGHRRIQSCGVRPPAIVDMGAFEFTGLGLVPKCLDRSPPIVGIGAGPLKVKNHRVSVKLSCPRGQSFCDGTVKLVRKLGRVLGSAHFRIKGGAGAIVKIKVGKPKSGKVTVKVSAKDRAGKRGTSSRKTTLM